VVVENDNDGYGDGDVGDDDVDNDDDQNPGSDIRLCISGKISSYLGKQVSAF
jgi:hypothetical protein